MKLKRTFCCVLSSLHPIARWSKQKRSRLNEKLTFCRQKKTSSRVIGLQQPNFSLSLTISLEILLNIHWGNHNRSSSQTGYNKGTTCRSRMCQWKSSAMTMVICSKMIDWQQIMCCKTSVTNLHLFMRVTETEGTMDKFWLSSHALNFRWSHRLRITILKNKKATHPSLKTSVIIGMLKRRIITTRKISTRDKITKRTTTTNRTLITIEKAILDRFD